MSSSAGFVAQQFQGKKINNKESVINLAPFVDKKIRVKFVGGREVVGVLKGADPICNLVLDETIEYRKVGKDQNDETKQKSKPEERQLGILVARGTSVLAICSEDGFSEIDNPYAQEDQ